METDIQKFYKDRTVFLTGATGFLGKVFLEKVLRTTQVVAVYVLIREKRGKSIQERIDGILNDALYEVLFRLKPDARKRVIPIFGDCALPLLGLSVEDRATLIKNVDIIVHGAATVRFNEPLSNAFDINVRATMDLLSLAKNMPKLKCFIYVSTAFSNCTKAHIEERFYPQNTSISVENMCKLVKIADTQLLNSLTQELLCDFPNTYTFTKSLAEQTVLAHGAQLPLCVFRPCIVLAMCYDPIPGWLDNFYNSTGLTFGCAKGVLRVLYGVLYSRAQVVPVDFCASLMLACGWKTGESQTLEATHAPLVYNLVPDEERNPIKWRDYTNYTLKFGLKMPLSTMMWYPFVVTTNSKLFYKFLCFVYHIIPGYFIDFMLLLQGKKRRMIEIYHKMHEQIALLDYFLVNDWSFATDNTKQLWKSMSSDDQRLYNFDMCALDWKKLVNTSLKGVRKYLAHEDVSTIPKAVRLLNILRTVHYVTHAIIFAGILMLGFAVFQRVYQLF